MAFLIPPPDPGQVCRTAHAYAMATIDAFWPECARRLGDVNERSGIGYAPGLLADGVDPVEMEARAVRAMVIAALAAGVKRHGYGQAQPSACDADLVMGAALVHFADGVDDALAKLGTGKACPEAPDGFAPWAARTWADVARAEADRLLATRLP